MISPSPELLAKLGRAANVHDMDPQNFDPADRWLMNQWFAIMAMLPKIATIDQEISFSMLDQMKIISRIMKQVGFSHADLFAEIIDEVIATARMIEAQGETRQ